MIVTVVPAEDWHADVIGAAARAADVAELAVTGKHTPTAAMKKGILASIRSFTGMVDGVPVCMFGANPYSILSGIGCVWMIGSTGLNPLKVQKVLLRESLPILEILQDLFPTLLYNFVDARNTSAIRWLKWLGFKFQPAILLGDEQIPFYPFTRARIH